MESEKVCEKQKKMDDQTEKESSKRDEGTPKVVKRRRQVEKKSPWNQSQSQQ